MAHQLKNSVNVTGIEDVNWLRRLLAEEDLLLPDSGTTVTVRISARPRYKGLNHHGGCGRKSVALAIAQAW